MSSTRLQRNNFSSLGRLDDVLEDEKLLQGRRLQDVLKDVLETNKMFTGDICTEQI